MRRAGETKMMRRDGNGRTRRYYHGHSQPAYFSLGTSCDSGKGTVHSDTPLAICQMVQTMTAPTFSRLPTLRLRCRVFFSFQVLAGFLFHYKRPLYYLGRFPNPESNLVCYACFVLKLSSHPSSASAQIHLNALGAFRLLYLRCPNWRVGCMNDH